MSSIGDIANAKQQNANRSTDTRGSASTTTVVKQDFVKGWGACDECSLEKRMAMISDESLAAARWIGRRLILSPYDRECIVYRGPEPPVGFPILDVARVATTGDLEVVKKMLPSQGDVKKILQETAWISYSPVSSVIENHFGTTEFLVSTLASGWMVSYVAFSVPAALFLKKFGLRATVVSAMLALSIGAAIRLGGCLGDEFWVLWVGQQISALCMIFTFQASPTMSRVWFGERERATATGIGFLSGAVGNMIAFFVVPAVVRDGRTLDALHYAECAASVVAFALVVIFFSDHPKTPPTRSSNDIIEMEEACATGSPRPRDEVTKSNLECANDDKLEPRREDDDDDVTGKNSENCRTYCVAICCRGDRRCEIGKTGREVISMVTDPACVVLWLVLTLEYGVYNTMCIVMEQRLPRFTQQQNGIVAGMMVVGGVTFTVVASTIVGKLRCYKSALIVASVVSIVGSVGFVAVEYAECDGGGGLAIAIVSAFVLGGCTLMATAIGMETAAEYTFPTHEILTSSVFSVAGCPAIVAMIVGAEFLSAKSTFSMVAAACCAATLASFFLVRKYKRTEADSRNRDATAATTTIDERDDIAMSR